MNKAKLGVGLILCVLGIWGCLTNNTDFVSPEWLAGGSLSDGVGIEYIYSGYDAEGTQILRGMLRLVTDDSNNVTGTWTLQLTVTDSLGRYGPQVGSGNLIGRIDGDKIGLELNPEYADNNVSIAGTMVYWGFYGTWQYAGFPGVLNTGTFRAVRSD